MATFGKDVLAGLSGRNSAPPPPAPPRRASASGDFDPVVDAAIVEAAGEAGIDPDTLRTFARIESGGNPTVRTGSYKGLFQLSDKEFSKHGGQGDIYDARENARVAALKLKAESEDFKRSYGREPTPAEIYMIHQQGVGGSAAHWANPDAPAWQNMYSTAEGRKKGPGWARQAIWGNVPNDVKKKYGSVDNMTSRDFLDMWGGKFRRMSLGGPKETDAPTPLPVAANVVEPQGEKAMTEILPWSNKPAEAVPQPAAGGDWREFANASSATRRRQRMADLLMKNAINDRPVLSPAEGIIRSLSALGGGYAGKTADDMEVGQKDLMMKMLGGNLSPIEQFAFATGNDDLIKTVIANRMKPAGSDLTSDQKNFQAAQKDPAFKEFLDSQNLAKRPYEDTQTKVNAEYLQKMAEEIDKKAMAAGGTLNSIAAMKVMANDPQFYSGVGSQGTLLWKKAVAALGGDPEAARPMETFNALSNKLVVDVMGGSLGTGVSNADVQFLQKTVANLDNSIEGNLQLIDITERIGRREIEVAQFLRDYRAQHDGKLDNNFVTALAQWSEANPLFGPGEALYQRGQKSPQSFLPQQPQEVAPPTEQQTPAQSPLPEGWSYKGAR